MRDRESGFHAGELAVQEEAGVREVAARLEGMLQPARLSEGVSRFLAERTFVAMTARGDQGRLWTSARVGDPGFLQVVDPVTLRIRATPDPDDPLLALDARQPLGLIAIDYERRRRFRLNGIVLASEEDLTLEVSEAFGNCPQFLPQRTLDVAARGRIEEAPGLGGVTDTWGAAERALIRAADTFILGTTHPDRGSDASHRGGPPGFVRVEGDTMWWPDYAGNNMFTSLGNLGVDDEAALLFFDFGHRTALHLNGRAELTKVAVGAAGDDDRTGRRVVFTVHHVRQSGLAARSFLLSAYPGHPPITD